MEYKVATAGDMHTCPMCSGTTPHIGGPIIASQSGVFLDGKPIAVIGDSCTCAGGPPDTIVQGHPGMTIGGKPVAVQGAMTAHGGVIAQVTPGITIRYRKNKHTPLVTLPLKKIPFPKIDVFNKLIGNAQEAIANQEKLQQAATDQQGDPAIIAVTWLKEERITRKQQIIKQVTLQAHTVNIPDGQQVSFSLTKPATGSQPAQTISVTGTVQDNYAQGTWETPEQPQ